VRDFIHICDLAQAHMLAMKPGPSGFFNLGTGDGFSVRQVIQACETVAGARIKVVEKSRRAGDPPRLVAAAGKARQELGWKPAFSRLEDIVSSAWAWHKKHPQGYPD
jgi:UDP-glucose 4-epimerase